MASAADIAQAATQLAALTRRMGAIEAFMQSNRLPDATGTGERNLAKAIMDLEIRVNALMQDKPLQQSNVEAIVADRMKAGVETLIDSKLRTAMQFVKTPQQSDTTGWNRSILESKAIQDLSAVVDSKQYRQWNKKAKNALDQIRPHSRRLLDAVEKITEDEINDAIQLRGYAADLPRGRGAGMGPHRPAAARRALLRALPPTRGPTARAAPPPRTRAQ